MAVRPIYLFGSDVLRKKAKPVEEVNNTIIRMIYDLIETMHLSNGIGLAATQVGALHQVIVIDETAVEEADQEEPERKPIRASERKTLVLINPEVIEEEGSWVMEEGCLSIPDVRAEVERAATVRIRFRDANFQEVMINAKGLLGRVILHEIDHLHGVLFIDRLSPGKRALLKGALRKIKKGEVETAYPVVSVVEV